MISRKLAVALATWGGSGFFPFAPGTFASLIAAAIAYLLVWSGLGSGWLAALAVLLFWPACWASGVAAVHFGRGDPREIVVDEVVGQWFALATARPGSWEDWLAAFLMFRLLDVIKPFAIHRLERLPGGLGIVADDAAAGLCAMMILAGLQWLSLW